MLNRRRLSYYAAIAATLLYNNWVLGIFLNPKATFAGATTSELGVTGQPHAMLFRLLDITAGFLFLLSIPSMASIVGNHRKYRWLLIIGVAVFGCSTIIESLVPLDCSSALDRICTAREAMGMSSWRDSVHIIESAVSYGLVAVMPLSIYLLLRRATVHGKLKLYSLLLLILIPVWGIEAGIRFLAHGQSFGYEQRLFIVLFTLWYYQVVRTGYTARLQPVHAE